MNNQNVDSMSVDEVKASIESYKQNLLQIESALEIQKNNSDLDSATKCKALETLKKDVKNAITFFTKTLEYKIAQVSFNTAGVTQASVGKCASIYYEADQKWYNGIINSIDLKNKTCNVTYFGYKETEDLPFKYIKPITPLPQEELTSGTLCDIIYKEDGFWYSGIIERTSELGIHVKFDKYKNEEIVQSDYIRITPEQKIENWKRKDTKSEEQSDKKGKGKFIIPENLKITPADSEDQRLLKRKRVKQLKNKTKQKEMEKISQEKQQNWLNFKKSLSSNRGSNNKTLNGFTPMINISKNVNK